MEERDLSSENAHRVASRSIQRELFFRTVYDESKKPLGAFLYRLLGEKQEMEDLYQEVLKKFWIHLQTVPKLPTSEETRKWLFTVARNQVIDHYRKQGKLQSGPLEDGEHLQSESTFMEDRLCERERLQWVLSRMSPAYRICLVLQDLYGYSQKEIATQLNIAEKTVSTNVLRGRKQLLTIWDDICQNKEKEAIHADKSPK